MECTFASYSTKATTMSSFTKDDLCIYKLPENVASSLEVVNGPVAPINVVSEPLAQSLPTQVKSLSGCNTCGLTFAPEADQNERLAHFKSDFHRLNVKLLAQGQKPLTEADFDHLVETQSVESISGSEDSESENDPEEPKELQALPTVFEKLATTEDEHEQNSYINNHSPFVLLKSLLLENEKAFGVYKTLFSEETLQKGTILEDLQRLRLEPAKLGISVLLMIGGGHFAGAVISHSPKNIKGNAKNARESRQEQMVHVIQSKTFHRYTTRRKQGGSQSASDNARGKANSAGSSIRRYNEQALQKEVRELLASWKEYVDKAEHIFIRANGAANRKILVGYEGAVVHNNDKRIKTFPFTTKRATLSEVKKAWARLSYLAVVDIPAEKKVEKKKVVEKSPSKTPEPEKKSPSDVHTEEIVTLIKKSKVPLLVNYLKKNSLDANFKLTPEMKYANTPTPLHFAASQGLHHMVKALLVNLKADPTHQNLFGKTAAQVSSTATVKSTFQIARSTLGEDYCDWNLAKVGPAKTSSEVAEEEEAEKAQRQKESRKLIEEELAKKTELEMKKPTYSSNGTVGGGKMPPISSTSGLSDAQKMRLMREQRARAAEARMKGGN